MIKLFGKTETSFSSNGDKIIKAIKARVKKVDNGEFYLELETDLSYVSDLEEGRIVVAPTPQGEQYFRVSNVTKTKNKITTKCLHVFFDSKNYLIEDSYVYQLNCNAALDHLNSATEPTSEFTTISDVPTVGSYRCVRKSLYEATQTLIERYGGHLVMDKFSIGIRQTIGEDRGVVVRYAKNLKEITCAENWDNVVTKLMPIGKEGLMLPNKYVTSQTQYAIPYTKTVSFSQDNIVQDDYTTDDGQPDVEAYQAALLQDLEGKAQAYVNANCVPQINYTTKANIPITDIGDTVQVIDDRLGLTLTTNVISYDYDVILGQYREVEFGNFKQTLSGLTTQIATATQAIIDEGVINLQATMSQELQEATDTIMEALGSGYCIYEPNAFLIVDRLPKEDAQNVLMINNNGIAFGQNGISGAFTSAWTIDGTLNMQAINVINLTADLIKGGTLKLGSSTNQQGQLEVYDEANTLIAELNATGLKVYGQDGSYVLLNQTVGFAGYDRNDNPIYWVSQDEFHQKKAVVEDEITLCNKVRFIPITITDSNNNNAIVNDGIGLVSVGSD
jgi:phage minor structural protein